MPQDQVQAQIYFGKEFVARHWPGGRMQDARGG